MNVEEFDELINTIPKVESDNPISAMDSINVEDLRNAVERFKKIPTYQDLLKENQELKEQLENEQNYSQSVFSDFQDYKEEASAYLDKIENQQKDFIEYLESEINLFEKYMKNIERSDRPHGDYPITYWSSKYRLNEVAEILSKYKEIIGVKDE